MTRFGIELPLDQCVKKVKDEKMNKLSSKPWPGTDTDTDAGAPASAALHQDARDSAAPPAHHTRRALATKVPQLTVFFWIVKVLTTGMGESTSDFLNQKLGPAIAVPIMLIGLATALALQFRARRYEAWIYWLVVVMVSVFGTSAADALHVVLGIPYIISTAFYLIVLAAIFTAWYASEKTLSIHSVYTPRREAFYWATVLATFALGTAAGDMTATTLDLGYFASGVMFAVLIALPAVAHWRFGLNPILAFWLAYILTRPLGASFADWGAVAQNRGGLGLGTGVVSLSLLAVIIGLVGYLAASRRDIRGEHAAPASAGMGQHAAPALTGMGEHAAPALAGTGEHVTQPG
jgi:uncharacterized membrane-anchored protein